MANDTSAHGAPDGTVSTRHPTQLAVLLASAGTPPFDRHRAAIAASRLFDDFVLAPGRRELFLGPGGLFAPSGHGIDPRHDALARVLRTIAAGLRGRIEAHETASGTKDLLRGTAGLAASRIEGQLGGFDPRRGVATSFSSELMLGSLRPSVDPIDAADAGILRRLLALSLRGAMVSKPARSSGLVTDLAGATLVLAVLDLAANPRSALRAVRAKLARSGRLSADESAWPREVGQSLREWLAQAIASASSSGSTSRELTREPALAAEVLDVFGMSLALAVYDGMVPQRESPLVVPGVGADEAFTAAPIAVGPATAAVSSPVLGLFSKIEFVALPFATIEESPTAEQSITESRPSLSPKPKALALEETVFAKTRESVKTATRGHNLVGLLEASIDPYAPAHTFVRRTLDSVASRITRAALSSEPSTQVVVLVGPRSARAREVLATIGKSLLSRGANWHILAPRPDTQTLAFEPLLDAIAPLRRADISRWIDIDLSRSIEFNVDPGANLVINASALGRTTEAQAFALAQLCSDVADRALPRSLVVLVGAPSYGAAAALSDALGRYAELELSDVPLRGGAISLLRVDAPAPASTLTERPADEQQLLRVAEAFTGPSPLAELAARALLVPAEARYRAQRLRLTQLSLAQDPTSANALALPVDLRQSLSEVLRALGRAANAPQDGAASRRAMQAGVSAQQTTRAALAAGMLRELGDCVRHEVAVLVAEYYAARGTTHLERVEHTARMAAMPWILCANSRAIPVVSDAAAELLESDAYEPVSATWPWMSELLGIEGVPPDRFVTVLSRNANTVLAACAEIAYQRESTITLRRPFMRLRWKIPAESDVTIGVAGSIIAGAFEASRRLVSEGTLRTLKRDGRDHLAVMTQLQTNASLAPVSLDLCVPLALDASESMLQLTALELGARIAGLLGEGNAPSWSAEIEPAEGDTVAVPLGEALVARECAARWVRALRTLPRYFPAENRSDNNYADGPLLRDAAELGLFGAVLNERGIFPGGSTARAIAERLQGAADEIVTRARELAATLPVVEGFAEGPAREVIERTLAVAWFLQANFCSSAVGSLTWIPPHMPGDPDIISRSLELASLERWLERKVERVGAIDQRIQEARLALAPTIIVEDE
ncbi:MAG: hypothetical protein Q8Q09_04335 [Deltaproteobacteria bacterium]|nr:hypothetical protein [Deltaproteobacteria bacterium]